MAINRSDFLRLSAWGFVAALLPIHQVKALSFISNLKSYNQDNYTLAINKAKQAKEHFYKKEYTQAESLYLECIELAPADIRFYDNLQNVYGAQGLWLMCVELFKNGLIANPNKIAFYDRAARSLMRLELGYPVIAGQYKNQINSNSLLQDAKQLYNQALQINPEAEYLKIGKKKVKRKINSDALNINYIINQEEKEARKERRKKHKKRYKQLTNDELIDRLQSIENKNRNTLYFENENRTRLKNIVKEKKLINTLLAKRFKKDQQYVEAIQYANEVYSLDNKDTRVVNILNQLYIKTNDYSSLLIFQRQHNENEQTVYSNLGLMKALNLKYKKEIQDSNLLNESISIGEDLMQNWSLLDSLQIGVVDKLSDTYLLNGSYSEAKNILKDIIESTTTKSEGSINILINCYAKAYFKSNQYNEAKDILLTGLKELHETEGNAFPYIEEIASKKGKNSFNGNLRLYYLLYKVYKKLNDQTNMSKVLQKLLQNNPEDKFALKLI